MEHALVSSRVGVIKEIQRIPKDTLEPELPFLYGASYYQTLPIKKIQTGRLLVVLARG